MNLVIFFFLNFIHAPWRFFTSFFCISTTEHYVTWEKGDEKFQIEFDVKVERSVDTTAAYMPNDWLVYCILHFDTACLMEATISNHLLHFKWKQLNFWIAGTLQEGGCPTFFTRSSTDQIWIYVNVCDVIKPDYMYNGANTFTVSST